jgi:Transposase DDE domain
VVRAWAIVPAAVSERDVATALLEAGQPPRDLLADNGFSGRAFAAAQAARGTAVLVPPAKKDRAAMPSALLKVIAQWRNRIETTFSEITVQMELARHGAHTFWGLLTRTAATIAAHTLLRVCLSHD